MDAKNHRVHGQLKRKPADFTHIFSVSTIDAILFLRHACFRKDMYDVHRFDTRKIEGARIYYNRGPTLYAQF